LMYCLRWKWNGNYTLPTEISLYDSLYYCLIPYIAWQLIYYIIVFVIYKNEVDTSQKFLIFVKGGLPAYLSKIPFGEKNALYGLMLVQFGYTILFTLPVHLFYKYQWLHASVIVLMGFCAISNGADFYFQIFAERYPNEVKQLAKTKLSNIQSGISTRKLVLFGFEVTKMLLIGISLALITGYFQYSNIYYINQSLIYHSI